MKWIALISKTGAELKGVCDRLGTCPSVILSDRSEPYRSVHTLDISHDAIMNMLLALNERCLITLHGYLRLIPEAVCDKHEIINCHPGDIISYPELKGLNPQKKAFDLSLDHTGVVIHRVTKEVDSGDILYYNRQEKMYFNHSHGVDILTEALRKKAVNGWVTVLKEYMND